jgi:uroporphyrinogen decarboxylase
LQGNLDPAVLLAGWDAVSVAADRVLASAAGLSGHVFNLGHGVLPNTDPDMLTRLVEHVHTATEGPPAT